MSHLLKTISLIVLVALGAPVAAQEASDTAPADATATEPPESMAPEAGDTAGAEADGATDGDTGTAAGSGDGAAAAEDGDGAAAPQGAAPDLSMGEEVDAAPTDGDAAEDEVGRTYTAATFGDWEQRCIRTEDGNDPCQLYQLLRDEKGNAVAEMSIFALPEAQTAAAGATIITPLETLLTRQITLAVDSGAAKRYPFDFCAQQGCFARVGFTDDEVAGFKRGAAATVTIVPAAAPDQEIALNISLSGFTAGYDAVEAANAE